MILVVLQVFCAHRLSMGQKTDHAATRITGDAAEAPPPLRAAIPRTFMRLSGLILCAIAFNAGMAFVLGQISTMNSISDAPAMAGLLLVALLGYAMLIAIPFMPGIEVGVALLLLQGATIAPFVYLATVTGLLFAFLIGRNVPLKMLHNAFRDLHMRRACEMIAQIERTAPSERLRRLQNRLPRWARPVVQYRYVMLGLLINVPGTFAIGGGGGIMMLAGILGLFRPSLVILTVAIATLPIPLAVYLWGADVLERTPLG